MADRFKQLTPDALEKLQKLEKKWGHCIIAYEQIPDPAKLTDDELTEVRFLEKDLQAVLVDYQC